jgi:hypothetical protein
VSCWLDWTAIVESLIARWQCGGMEEGNSVVAASPSLRPSAERRRCAWLAFGTPEGGVVRG